MKKILFMCAGIFLFWLSLPAFVFAQTIFVATTSVSISLCGDGLTSGPEQCDNGTATNTGSYSTSIAGRQCNSNCTLAAYCGDTVLQTVYDEECDDGNNTSNDFCSADCKAEPATTGGSGGGGGGGGGAFSGGSFTSPASTQVTIQGKAYPNSLVHILKDAKEIGTVTADANGDFLFTNTNISPGTATFGFWAEDSTKLRSVTYNTTFQVSQSAITTISGVLIPPSIKIDKRGVKKGETLLISGQAAPSAKIKIVINSSPETIFEATADKLGKWALAYVTTLPDANYTVKASYKIGTGTTNESGYSQSLAFGVGNQVPALAGTADLSRDGKVNLVDFSILLFHWGTNGGSSNPPADINGDAKVNLTDFSIMVFQWTG